MRTVSRTMLSVLKPWVPVAGLCTIAVAFTAGVAQVGQSAVEVKPAVSRGLPGILPTSVPADLSSDRLSGLGKNWADWSADTEKVVQSLYQAESVAPEMSLAALRDKLSTVEVALGDSRYAMIYPQLARLRGALGLRIELTEAVLRTLSLPAPSGSDRVNSAANSVVSKVVSLENFLASFSSGPAWSPYLGLPELKVALANRAVAPQLAAAAKVSLAKFEARDNSDSAAQAEFMSRAPFAELEQALKGLEAAALASEGPEAATQVLRDRLAELMKAVEDFAESGSAEAAMDIRQAFDAARRVSADGCEGIGAVLRKYLMNYNLRIIASEDFLNRLMNDSQCDQGPVRDCILGASVSGWQTTNTTVNLDLRPTQGAIRFALRVNGQTHSNTVGMTKFANVYTAGNATFLAEKEIYFRDDRFITSPATIGVNANNTTTGAESNIQLPIIRRIIQNIAFEEAKEKKGQSEAIAASRVRERVLPELNSKVDLAFAEASGKMESELLGGLRSANLYPDAQTAMSDETHLRLFTRLMGPSELGGSVPPASMTTPQSSSAVLLLHESVLNNSIDRIGLAGQTLSEPELSRKIEDFLSRALNRPFKFAPKEAAPTLAPPTGVEGDDSKEPRRFTLAPQGPIRIQTENGSLVIVIRALFDDGSKAKSDDDEENMGDASDGENKKAIQYQTVRIPITLTVSGESISSSRGEVTIEDVAPVKRKVIKQRLEDALDKALKERPPASGRVEFKGANNRVLIAYINSIEIADGWIALRLN